MQAENKRFEDLRGESEITFTAKFEPEDHVIFKPIGYEDGKVHGEIWVNGKYESDAVFMLDEGKKP